MRHVQRRHTKKKPPAQHVVWRVRMHLGLVMLSMLLAGSVTGVAAQQRPVPRVLSLDEALALAVKNSPQIKEEQFGVLKRQSQRAQADAARFAQLDINAVVGPSPRARGNQITSPDSKTDPALTGVFGLATIKLIQPLYTFGKIDSLREAAAHGIAVSQAQVNERATNVAMLVHEAYYGYLLAVSLENLGLEVGDQLGSSLDKIRRQLEAGAPGVDNIDALKLQTFQGELEKQLNDIREGKELALTGLRTLLNLDPAESIELADKALDPQVRETASLEQYLADARQFRPEFTQAREGVKAYEKLVDATKADYYPVIFFGVFGAVAEATNRDRFGNPFVYDRLKDTAIAPVLGVQWKFNLGITAGKVEGAE